MRPALPWIVALVGSVLINGALVGYLVHRTADGPRWHLRDGSDHAMMRHDARGGPGSPGSPDGPGGRPGFDLRSFVDALPAEARDEARRRLRETFSDVRERGRESIEARRELDTLLVAEDFDADAVAAAMERMRTSQRAVEARIEAVVLDVVADLDAETRAAALQAGRERIGRERFGRRGPPREGFGRERRPGEPRPDDGRDSPPPGPDR